MSLVCSFNILNYINLVLWVTIPDLSYILIVALLIVNKGYSLSFCYVYILCFITIILLIKLPVTLKFIITLSFCLNT